MRKLIVFKSQVSDATLSGKSSFPYFFLEINMQDTIQFEPLVPENYHHYIEIGTKSYNQHYKHLWPKGNTDTYIQNSFTLDVLLKEEKDYNTHLFMIKYNQVYVGILKITLNKPYGDLQKDDVLFLDKIYILKEHSGKGIGAKSILFLEEYGRKLSKKVIILESIQKGPAKDFYLTRNFNIVGSTSFPFKNVIESEKPMYVLMKTI